MFQTGMLGMLGVKPNGITLTVLQLFISIMQSKLGDHGLSI